MPKFYHIKDTCGIDCKARAVGWRRIPPFSFLPYLTSESISIHLSIKRLYEDAKWKQGTLQIEPAILDDEWKVALSDTFFEIEQPEVGRQWSGNILVNHGYSFFKPYYMECIVKLQNDKNQQCSIHIADIDVVSRGTFITDILKWVIAPIVAFLLGKFL